MRLTAAPTRVTVDFRDAALPSRTWILGVDQGAADRLDLIAFDDRDAAPIRGVPGRSWARESSWVASALLADCACPDFCERDHANE